MNVKPQVSCNLDASQVARYVIALDSSRPEPDVTQLKLQKILYLAQANYLASTGCRLFDSRVEAFENGPVVPSVLAEYGSYGRTVIAPDVSTWDEASIPQDARAFIDAIWDRYKDRSASALWQLTHAQAPWQDAYVPNGFHVQIPDAAMASYFREKVPATKRVFHPDVVVVDSVLLNELDEDEDSIVERAVAALR
jgi:uncharacterized phage-associated protein